MYPGHELTRPSRKTMSTSRETTSTERITSVPTCNDGGRGGKKKKVAGHVGFDRATKTTPWLPTRTE